jgi:integrase
MAIKWGELKQTKYPGVRRSPDGSLVVQIKGLDQNGKIAVRTRKLPEKTTLEQAVLVRARMGQELKDEREVQEGVQIPTLTAYARRWIKRKVQEGLREHTVDRYVEALEGHILPVLGDLIITEIQTQDILRWRDTVLSQPMKNGKEYSKWTLDAWFRVLRSILTDVTIEYGLVRSPCEGVRGIRKPRSPRASRCLNLSQLRQFLDLVKIHCPQHYAITLVLVAYGLRWEEASGLHLRHIDEESMELRLVQAHVRGKIYPTKSESQRILPLDRDLLQVIREHQRLLTVRHNPGVRKGILFPAINGTYRVPSSVTKAWQHISKLMGLSWNVSPHDLRRSHQNLLRLTSTNQVVQQALMGHSSDKMSEHYSHVSMEEKREVHQGIISLLDYRKDRAGEG